MIKPALHALCQTFIEQRISAARTAMQAAQESSSSETKSSAGDKYETGREMANAERDRNAAHMQQAQQLQAEHQRGPAGCGRWPGRICRIGGGTGGGGPQGAAGG